MGSHKQKIEHVFKIMEGWSKIDPAKKIPTGEFIERRRRVWNAISKPPYSADIGFAFSDEHYSGDVPYLFGNTNVAIEQVAGAVGPSGLNTSGIIAGFEGVYIASQLAKHGGTRVENFTGFYGMSGKEIPEEGKLPRLYIYEFTEDEILALCYLILCL